MTDTASTARVWSVKFFSDLRSVHLALVRSRSGPARRSHLISGNVTKTAASKCDLWNGASLAMISRPGWLAPFSTYSDSCG